MNHPLFALWLQDTFPDSEISHVQREAAQRAFELLYPEIQNIEAELSSLKDWIEKEKHSLIII
jgi:hypothetical protein